MERFDFSKCHREISEHLTELGQQELSLVALLSELRQIGAAAPATIDQQGGDRSLIACGPGCSSCCVVNVDTLVPEGVAIVDFLTEQGAGQVVKIAARLETLWCEVRGLDDEERQIMRRPCAFLDESGCCSIYPVRPLLCRSVTSTAAESCRDALAGQALGEQRPVLMHQFQLQLYETLFSGFAEGLGRMGLAGDSYPLTGLVRYLLHHPAATDEWLAGRRLTWQDIA